MPDLCLRCLSANDCISVVNVQEDEDLRRVTDRAVQVSFFDVDA